MKPFRITNVRGGGHHTPAIVLAHYVDIGGRFVCNTRYPSSHAKLCHT